MQSLESWVLQFDYGDDDDDDDGYGDEAGGVDSDGNSGVVAAGIRINAEYGNIISIMHYILVFISCESFSQEHAPYTPNGQEFSSLFIYRSNTIQCTDTPTMHRRLYNDKPKLGPFRAKVHATKSRPL